MTPERTDIFTVPAKAYATAYARQHAGAWVAALAVPVLAAVVAGFYDMRWWIVGLMALMIVYPMVLTMAWLTLTGRPSMAMRLRPQQWTFGNGGSLDVDFFRFDVVADEAAGRSPVGEVTSAISAVKPCGAYYAVRLVAGAPFDILLIPSRMMPTELLNDYPE